jgi:integrase
MENSLYFERALVPAHSIALSELKELFLKYHPKLDKSDTYAVKQSFDILLKMFPENEPKPDTATFKVGYLVKFQKHIVELGYARTQINRLFGLVKRVFAWGGKPRFDLETYDKLPAIVSNSFIADMNAIERVTDEGKENPPRKDVPEHIVTAVFPFVSETIADMLRIQLLTGMRPKEVCMMRNCNIKRTKEEFAEYGYLFDNDVWIYILPKHKTEKYIGVKAVPLGIEEQEILSKYVTNIDDNAPIFQNSKKKELSRAEYGRKIKKAIEKNGLKKFIPYQIRHTAITKVSLNHNRDTARAVAGHTTEKMTARYDHADLEKALKVVRERNATFIAQRKVAGNEGYDVEESNIPILRIFTGE